nr:FAD-binding oxidoreductase [Lysobacter sp. CAU 1642]
MPLDTAPDRLPDGAAPMLAFGNGRSYGDSCLNAGGSLLLTRRLDHFLSFDADTGVLECEAGITLGEIQDFAVRRGYLLPVTPGTQFATVGGAIANDVHGKNHHVAGSFGEHVEQIELVRSDGRTSIRPGEPLFHATVGGLGLTGLITHARLRLLPVTGPWMDVESIRMAGLGDFFGLSRESARTHAYTVAWIDCLARGAALGRGHFLRASHAEPGATGRLPVGSRSLPVTPPVSLVNRLSLRPFNILYFHRQRRERVRRIEHFRPYFYPLDAIRGWNRMYGPKGFLQNQCVLPPATAEDGVRALLDAIARSGQGSFLAVLKEFGDRPAPGLLSFCRPGTTLALDFPRSEATLALLQRLDAIVMEAGGAVYPAKDARMSPAMFRAGQPRLDEFIPHIDPAFSSSFWRRVMEPSCNAS